LADGEHVLNTKVCRWVVGNQIQILSLHVTKSAGVPVFIQQLQLLINRPRGYCSALRTGEGFSFVNSGLIPRPLNLLFLGNIIFMLSMSLFQDKHFFG
jgi:hypothetical protein